MRGVRIENFAPFAGERHPDAIIIIHIRRKIHHHEAPRAGVAALADPAEDVAAGIVGHHPFEAGRVAIQLVQRRQPAINPVEVADQGLDAGVLALLDGARGRAWSVARQAPLAAADGQRVL